MKKNMDTTRRDFLIAIAKNYYLDDFSQREIAQRYKISRSNVSKLLKVCKEENIVEIRIQSPSSQAIELKVQLEKTFDLEDAVVAPTEADPEGTLIATSRAGANFISSTLKNNLKIGISWGSSVYQLIQEIDPVESFEGIEVIQFHGGFGSTNPEVDGYELTGILARKLKGIYRVIHAPAVVQNVQMRDMLLREPNIMETITAAGKVEIALLGIGSMDSETNSMVRAGYLSKEESDQLRQEGAQGIICGHHFDREGRFLDLSFNNRFIGISSESLLSIPKRIGIALGLTKVESILGALRGKLINVLVTDEQTAKGILYLHDTEI